MTPIPDSRRTPSGIAIAAIRFGATIVLSECRSGGLPLLAGPAADRGLGAIMAGRFIGNRRMGAMAGTGDDTELPTMVLARAGRAFGRKAN